ncbi:MAG: putative DNA binding domain-containing protein [Victivallales bacterium]|nr:putative DNA binding domain-containing protein [Victivallales bacterium]
MMNKAGIDKLREQGEGTTIEFKRGGQGARNDTFESYCAFLNREGGDILLGVEDDGTVVGLPPNAVKDMVKNLISAMNDANLLNPPFCVLPEILDYEDKKIIHMNVPKSTDVHRFRGVCYDRIDESDIKVTSSDQIAQMYIRKRNIYTEQTLYPDVIIDDLRSDLIPRVKMMACAFRPDHPWKELSDIDLLRSAKLNVYDTARNAYCFNAAAILLLGKDEIIVRYFPAYKTDALLQRVNEDRYDDRLTVATNLIESYDQLIAFGQKWLPDKFYLENGATVSLRDKILRETIGNLLIHREYTSSRPGRLIIRKGEMFADNANKVLQPGHITLRNLCPRAKNPVIADFFQAIGRADELGSGVRNLYKYVKLYSGAEPIFDEEDVFTLSIPLDNDYNPEGNSMVKNGMTVAHGNGHQIRQAIIDAICRNSQVSIKTIAEQLNGITPAQVRLQLNKMKEEGVLHREGPSGNGGRWILHK